MKKIGIIGAMGSEVELLKSLLKARKETVVAGKTFYEGELGNFKVFLVCSGIGKVNSAMSAQILIDKFSVDAVINTGIAGGANGVKVRDVVISDEVLYHDMNLRFVAMSYPNLEVFKADKTLIAMAQKACENENITSVVGRIATGDQFIADKEVKADIVKRLSPSAVEMEGGAVAHVCSANDIPFLVIRSISDNADDGAEIDLETFEKLAADDAARIVADMLS